MSFKRALGPFDATMVVIGGIIGSGIFINPYIVAQRLDSTVLVLAAWAAGGAIALAGAFAYAELGALFPKAGGQYVYLRDGYHPLAGFLYGWALLALIESGAIAAVAITFATYALRLVGRPDVAPVPLAVAAVVLLSFINYLGVKPGSRVLNVLVVLKVAALAVLIGAGMFAPAYEGWWTAARDTGGDGLSTAVAFGAALVPILFAYGGWQNANYVAEEIENPRRNLPISLLAGTTAVVLIYVAVNAVYIRALGLEGLAGTTTPASTAAAIMFGPTGDTFVTAAIAISTFGFLNLGILAPTRVYYAMAADRVFFPSLAKLHPIYRTPWVAILIQSTWTCVLALTGRYEQLLNYVVFADWIFFGLTVGTVLVFRRTTPLATRPAGSFRAPGYPIVPVVFVIVSAAVVLSVVWADPSSAARGALLLAAGIPVFYWFDRRGVRRGSDPKGDLLRFHAPYMEWAKRRPSPKYDLAISNVLACTIDDIPGARDALSLSGRNDNGYAPLLQAIASRYGVRPEQVNTAQGASGANFLVCAALLEPGDDVLVERPGYDPLLGAPRLLGANVIRVDRLLADGYALDPDRVRRALTPRTRLIVVTSPHNPTGAVVDDDALEAIGRMAAAQGAHVVVDEVYLDTMDAPVRPAATRGGPFISTSSLTKSYGLAGLRCGWVLSSGDVAERIRRSRDVVDGTGPIVAERLATAAFEHLESLTARAHRLLARNRTLVTDFVRERPELEWVEPTGGTVAFPRIGNVADTSRFAERLLLERETAVVPGRFFEAPAHFRLGFSGETDRLEGGLAAIGAALDARAW